jgi:SAM-dependent methyltransferase
VTLGLAVGSDWAFETHGRAARPPVSGMLRGDREQSTMSVGSRLAQAAIRRRDQRLYAAMGKLAFAKSALASARRNLGFRRRNPGFPVPPLHLLWDAQSHTDYETYKTSGEESAALYWKLIQQYVGSGGAASWRVIDWGCGPGRIIRHLPALSRSHPDRFEFYGTDYNRTSIEWCRRSLPGITFNPNRLAPPLDFEEAFFDVLYCRSVFTHLSKELHFAWLGELCRVVKPGGVLMLSTQGNAYRERLLDREKERFDRGELVVRELAEEGKLNYSAFHPPRFVRERLLSGLQVLEHREGRATQDIWIVRNQRPISA